ncbi:uncharacterized protein LOC124686028 [Lolium rigidum]|uniref:uncharacterized protein LOC124686028 n=1 Tax=Lolium rigidum TaxID=89674 RepID=UPI001F5E2D66|nr:uncharacterized protein LOC124686028 [Lolium rigidum]
MARLATILSFGDHADDDADVPETEQHEEYREEQHHDEDDDATSVASDDSFEFAFARPLVTAPHADALADDLFAHGRIIPAYPVFHRHHDGASASASASSATAPPSPDTYCAWTPRSAPGSPAREPATFPKSASTGQSVPRFRIRDLIGSGAGRRSNSDGKEKFLFIQPSTPKTTTTTTPPASAAPAAKKPSSSSSQPKTKQSKKKGAAPVTEMDMATAHRLFYSKPAATGTERPSTTTKKSYLPYRPAIVGFFAAAHGLRPKHHPY